jgi:hypothetical protein
MMDGQLLNGADLSGSIGLFSEPETDAYFNHPEATMDSQQVQAFRLSIFY